MQDALPCFVALFNSTPFDYLYDEVLWSKSDYLLMQAFVLPLKPLMTFEDELFCSVCALTNGSGSVEVVVGEAGYPDISYATGAHRNLLRARIDAGMFHLFEISVDEASYIFDTFRIWREKRMEDGSRFLSVISRSNT